MNSTTLVQGSLIVLVILVLIAILIFIIIIYVEISKFISFLSSGQSSSSGQTNTGQLIPLVGQMMEQNPLDGEDVTQF
jgi:hypothetical protein